MLKFHSPKPTKSGDNAVKVWNELKETWGFYKTARLESNLEKMREYAKRIRDLQEDFGITKAEFPELKKFKVKIQN